MFAGGCFAKAEPALRWSVHTIIVIFGTDLETLISHIRFFAVLVSSERLLLAEGKLLAKEGGFKINFRHLIIIDHSW